MGKRKERWGEVPTRLFAVKFKVHPTPGQADSFDTHMRASSIIYNNTWWRWFVEYHMHGKRSSTFDAIKTWRQIRPVHYPWIGLSCNSYVESYTIEALNLAFQHFFRRVKTKQLTTGGNYGFPRRKRKLDANSFSIYGGQVKLSGKFLEMPAKFEFPVADNIDPARVLPKRSLIKIGFLRKGADCVFPKTDYVVHKCTIRKQAGEYWCSLQLEQPILEPVAAPTGDAVVAHRGAIQLLTTTEKRYMNTRWGHELDVLLRRVKMLQRALSKKKIEGSGRYKKAQLRLQKTHAKIGNMRQWLLHNISADLTQRHNDPSVRPATIVMDNFDIAQLVATTKTRIKVNRHRAALNRKLLDAGMGELARQIQYKSGWMGIQVVKIEPKAAITHTCSVCEHDHPLDDREIRQREWQCTACQTTHDIEENAVANILAHHTEPIEDQLVRDLAQ